MMSMGREGLDDLTSQADSKTGCIAYLVGEQLAIILGGQVRLCGLRGVELQTLADALSQHIQRRVGLHDLGQRLDDQRLDPLKPVAEGAMQIVGQVEAHHHTCKEGRLSSTIDGQSRHLSQPLQSRARAQHKAYKDQEMPCSSGSMAEMHHVMYMAHTSSVI